MWLIDDETLKLVGRFTIEFNTLDDLITNLAATMLECTEWDTAQYLTDRITVTNKLERIKAVCNVLAKAHRPVAPTFTEPC